MELDDIAEVEPICNSSLYTFANISALGGSQEQDWFLSKVLTYFKLNLNANFHVLKCSVTNIGYHIKTFRFFFFLTTSTASN